MAAPSPSLERLLPVAPPACPLPSSVSVLLNATTSPPLAGRVELGQTTDGCSREEATPPRPMAASRPLFLSAAFSETEGIGLTSGGGRMSPAEPSPPELPVSGLPSVTSDLPCDTSGQSAGRHAEVSGPASDSLGQTTGNRLETVLEDAVGLAGSHQTAVLSSQSDSREDNSADASVGGGVGTPLCCTGDSQVTASSRLQNTFAAATNPVQNGMGTGLYTGDDSLHCAALSKEIDVGSECIAMETQSSDRQRRKRRAKAMEQDGPAAEEDSELLICLKPIGITKYSPASYVARQLARGLHEVWPET